MVYVSSVQFLRCKILGSWFGLQGYPAHKNPPPVEPYSNGGPRGVGISSYDDRAGVTPLHAAAAQGHASVVQMLLQTGASPAVKDTRGRTPLDVGSEHREVVALLMGP